MITYNNQNLSTIKWNRLGQKIDEKRDECTVIGSSLDEPMA